MFYNGLFGFRCIQQLGLFGEADEFGAVTFGIGLLRRYGALEELVVACVALVGQPFHYGMLGVVGSEHREEDSGLVLFLD